MTVIINKNLSETLIRYAQVDDLKPFLSTQFKDVQFRSIITSDRATAISKISKILKPNEKISDLHIVVHGRSGVEINDQIALNVTEQLHIGSIYSEYDLNNNVHVGGVDPLFRNFFESIKYRVSPDANIVFTSCNNLDLTDTESNNEKAKAIANFFGIRNGSVYFSSSLDTDKFFLNLHDYTYSMMAKEHLFSFLKIALSFSVVYGAMNSSESFTQISLIGTYISLLVMSISTPMGYYMKYLQQKIKTTGWLFVFKKGDIQKIEIKDKGSSYSKIFGVEKNILMCRDLFF